MGDRPLAYVIKKKERGHYILFTMNLDPQGVTPAEKMFKLNPNLLKYPLRSSRGLREGGRNMSDLAVAVIVGRLTRDAELKYTNSGQAVCHFFRRDELATQERRSVGGGTQLLGRRPLGQARRVDQPVPDQGQARRDRGRHAPGQMGAGRPDADQDSHLGQYRPVTRVLGGPGRLFVRKAEASGRKRRRRNRGPNPGADPRRRRTILTDDIPF